MTSDEIRDVFSRLGGIKITKEKINLNLTSPRVVQQLLTKYSLTAKKQLGQNFLIDANILRKIVSAANLYPSDLVLEVGTGIGALTTALSEKAGHVLTIETDHSLAPLLEQVLAGRDNVRVMFGDILQFNPADLFKNSSVQPKVVANLPYYITTPILFHLLESNVKWDSLVFLVQKEVAERIVSSPGNKVYGALSVMIQHYCKTEIVGVVPPTVFLPKPKVNSAIIRLIPKQEEFSRKIEKTFSLLVKTAFTYRRKNLYNSLRGIFDELGGETKVMEAFETLNIKPSQRGETLSPEEFYALAAYCSKFFGEN